MSDWTLIVLGSGGRQTRRLRVNAGSMLTLGLAALLVLCACVYGGWQLGSFAAGPAARSAGR